MHVRRGAYQTMAGRAITRARRESGLVVPTEAINNAKAMLFQWLPECLTNTMEVARGVYYERTVKGPDGELVQRVYKREPNLMANMYLIDRAMGKPRVESSPIDDALTEARTNFINTQLSIDWLNAQARDMAARARRAEIECELYPKQFVTEEEQEAKLRDIARESNKALMNLTPEEFARIAPGVTDPAAALEALKGKLGRDQAAIFEAVMSGGAETADEDEEEDDE